jgi:hypothetical protein
VSEFEFLFTGISIVLALAVARLLEGLRDCFDPTRRFWIHYLWVVNRLMIALSLFWSLFDDRARTDLTFVSFLSLVTPPSILFLQASALVTAHPDKVSDWGAHFWTVRKWFFGSNMVMVLGSFFVLAYLGEQRALSYAPLVAGLCLSIAGYSTSNVRVHAVLSVFATLSVGGSLVRIAFYG